MIWTPETLAVAVRMRNQGATYATIAKRLGVSRCTAANYLESHDKRSLEEARTLNCHEQFGRALAGRRFEDVPLKPSRAAPRQLPPPERATFQSSMGDMG